jgi:acyl-CoA reductase-like NAD-dependent aldehyde dehydrogenase
MMAKAVRATSPNSEPTRYDGFETMLLNGSWRQGRSGRVSEDRDPYTNDVLVRIALADEQDLEDGFRAAAAAQPQWYEMLPGERSAIIRHAAEIIDQRREEIIDWLIHESGSTRIKANVEWQYARAVTFEAASFPSRVEGPIVPTDIPHKESRVYRQPVGVVGMISPWNFPFHLSSRSVAPALSG